MSPRKKYSPEVLAWAQSLRRRGAKRLYLPDLSLLDQTPVPPSQPLATSSESGFGQSPSATLSLAVESSLESTSTSVPHPSTSVPTPSTRPQVRRPQVQGYRQSDEETMTSKAKILEQLELPLKSCTACPLHSGRTNLVYGVGNPDADLMFVGEGPGRDEDLQGIPFVGRAGKLLTDMIQKGLGIPRTDVYIANIVKCRPPQNRNPEPAEATTCLPNLLEQIRIVEPKVIVTLGGVPAQWLLGTKKGITRLRGTWHQFESTPLMPTLHPAYLLRNPNAKHDCWEDLKQVIAFLNGDLSPEFVSQGDRA